MKKGDIYRCEDCGLELQVITECKETEDDCGCQTPCTFSCCGIELTKKVV
jgi:hypothetical protein